MAVVEGVENMPEGRVDVADLVSGLAAILEKDPNNFAGWKTLFGAGLQLGTFEPALDHLDGLIERISNPELMFIDIARALLRNGWVEDAEALLRLIVVHQPAARSAHSELIGLLQLYGDEAAARQEYAAFNERFARPLTRNAAPLDVSRDPDKVLRIGFVSNDFAGSHSLITVLEPWFYADGGCTEEFFLYSNMQHGEPPHGVFRDRADCFVDVSGYSDEALDERIRNDCIDILVDLISHGRPNRQLMYARKPAPLIVSWIGLGIPNGLEAVDYLLADEVLVPWESADRYQEKIAYFQGVSMVWRPPAIAPNVQTTPMARSGFPIFGNLTRLVKFRPESLALWGRVMQRVPDAKMLFKDPMLRDDKSARLISMFEANGIAEDRLIFRAGSTQTEHLAAYNEVDLILDCFPQNGGISSLEALWMGVPVVSLSDPVRPSGRAGRYFLHNIGLDALVAETEADFVDIAAALVRNADALAPFRANLRQRLAGSGLCDVSAFTRDLGLLLRHMWRHHCAGKPPETFRVSV